MAWFVLLALTVLQIASIGGISWTSPSRDLTIGICGAGLHARWLEQGSRLQAEPGWAIGAVEADWLPRFEQYHEVWVPNPGPAGGIPAPISNITRVIHLPVYTLAIPVVIMLVLGREPRLGEPHG